MKKIEEIIVEFSSLENDKKEPYLESLSDEELRIFLPHVVGWWPYQYYKEFIEDLLSKRVLEKRNNKLDNLGI